MDDNNPEISLLIDDQVFKAKRNDLMEHSDFFRAMFTGDYVERERKQIFIEVVDAASMSIILRYINIGLIDLSEFDLPTIGDLAVAASFLQITELTKQIEYCLEQQLTLANWLEVKEVALNAALVKLEQSTVVFGLFSFSKMKTENIQSLDKLYWYLAHPYLNLESELDAFKFGLKWLREHEMGADTLLVVLCCLDLKRLSIEELIEMRELITDFANSLGERVVECLYKLLLEHDLSLDTIRQNKEELCLFFTEKVYTEVFNLVKESVQRKLKYTPTVPMWSNKDKKPEASQNYLFTYTEDAGFQRWMEVAERNLWGWNITAWSPTQIVVVCGEYGRGSGIFMRDVKVYDVYKKEWTQHGVELPVRRHAGVVVVDDSLYLLGGVGGFRVVLDSAVVYNLKERTFRSIAKLPDAVQSPAVCAHDDEVYVIGHRNIYKYEEICQKDRWTKVLTMDITPTYLVSFKGYIYVAQCYFPSLYRFIPGDERGLQQIASFCHPPRAICNLGYRLIAVTCSGDTSTDILSVEELRIVGDGHYYQNTDVLWSETGSEFGVNPSGACAVVMTMPEINPNVSAYHQRYIVMYG
ncbi:unnamed protein product [Spodoptera littoralis]|uniref:BTB domain-containing protein n=1 Tax=Spodoptera littoralis TaxID=7109 RepID=A0A9P0N0Z0_SPOLI|nr:unnamed protein product [Spodoptera littoralis]CAH1637609.1 unnamed protein product [Spodoptera littoralis]